MLLKPPMPVPSIVASSLSVGLPVVFQTIPRAVIGEPPLLTMLASLDADVPSMEDTLGAATIGVEMDVVKLRTLLYAVPAEFVA